MGASISAPTVRTSTSGQDTWVALQIFKDHQGAEQLLCPTVTLFRYPITER